MADFWKSGSRTLRQLSEWIQMLGDQPWGLGDNADQGRSMETIEEVKDAGWGQLIVRIVSLRWKIFTRGCILSNSAYTISNMKCSRSKRRTSPRVKKMKEMDDEIDVPCR